MIILIFAAVDVKLRLFNSYFTCLQMYAPDLQIES
jgi:hypothetical protein